MRIVLANWSTRRVGGVESYLDAMIPALRAAGHALAFAAQHARPDDRATLALDELPVWLASERGVDGVAAAIAGWRPDVVFAHNIGDAAFEAMLQRVAPAVWFAHAYYGTCVSGTKTHKLPSPRPCGRELGWGCLAHYYPHRCGGLNPVTMARRFVAENARRDRFGAWRAIVTGSAHMHREYARHVGDPSRVHDVPMLVPGLGAPRPAPPPAGGPVQLLFLGRMDYEKGAHLAIDALPRVADALGRPVRLVLGGDGPARDDAERAAVRARRHAGVAVELRGWMDRAAADAALADADLLVVPSCWPEPFGLVGPEAGSRGVPAAAFAVGGIPSWLTDGENGHLAPADPPRAEGLADAVVRALRDPAHHARLREGALRLAHRFTAARHLAAVVPILERAAGAAGAASGAPA